ncbi:Putative HAD superfamily, LIPIN family protein [Septoria linicola]|uniref:HAD superfamily, LIPIN family protein n=1 Tax=Septoria linicola TaxID=215465 RepID=A0A9Q9AQI1_9PEZI|nr:putative HAD superfamily, LIPIN family protein [Septoria linicola]USW53584.1 Putative HAD superfamily, LIPIN family protein [Septoria linicola]
MQYVRSITGSVSSTWNSINPATLSGAIDVVVVEQEDGSLACSPFHIRFGKFSLLRPSEKKVEFKVNGEKLDFPMKLGVGGEAFFVFETHEDVPEALQTSPLVSPAASPELKASAPETPALQEPDPFDLEKSALGIPLDAPYRGKGHSRSTTEGMPITSSLQRRPNSDMGNLIPLSNSPNEQQLKPRPLSGDFSSFHPTLDRTSSDSALPAARAAINESLDRSELIMSPGSERAPSPLSRRTNREASVSAETAEAKERAMNLSKKLWTSNISNQVTESGDLMLDMSGYGSGNAEALQAEGIARQLLSEELEGPYDIGSLIGADEKGNIWIYSSEEAKDAANKRAAAAGMGSFQPSAYASVDAISDPGYHSDDARSVDSKSAFVDTHHRRDSDSALGIGSQPSSPAAAAGDPNKNYAKTLRLTSDQLKGMDLKSGANSMAFTVNRATCQATLWYWRHDVPIVISDIDGTITKSDVLGHVLNTIGRDWTHQGVAKLYTEIAANGYNFLYLTSRSVGQADTTRAYLKGVAQEGYKLPPGPVILSPDRTIAALRREVYLRKPEIFKMACLRDIMSLFSGHGGAQNITENALEAGLKPMNGADMPGGLGTGRGKSGSPFYAGFGNRLTDALSYRSVNIPSTRIFTINSNSEVSLDLLSLNTYKTAYNSMREIVDHYFPPVGLLVKGGGEEFTDFNYWRSKPLDIVDFTDSEDEDEPINSALLRLQPVNTRGSQSVLSEDEAGDDMMDSYLSDGRPSLDQSIVSALERDEEYYTNDELTQSMIDEEEDGDDEEEDEDESETGDDDDESEAEDSRGGARSPVNRNSPRTPQLSPGNSDVRTPRQTSEQELHIRHRDRREDPETGLGISQLTPGTAKNSPQKER